MSKERISKVFEKEASLTSWIENGYSKDAIAAYGGSVHILQEILQTGNIPSWPIDEEPLSYQQSLINKHGHLYYFTPIFKEIKSVRPKLVENITRRIDNFDPNTDLTIEAVRRTSKAYAFNQSVIHAFKQATNQQLSLDDLFTLAEEIIPQKFNHVSAELTISDVDLYESDPEKLAKIKKEVASVDLAQALSESFQRRGVIFFFNKKIFTGNTVYAGVEGPTEFIVGSSQRLSADTISGVEILSDVDLAVVR